MSPTAQPPATPPIPVPLSAPECEALLLPHLSMPKRGPQCTLGSHRVLNATDLVLFPEGLQARHKVAKEGGLARRRASLNRAGGFDAARHRPCLFNAGRMPNRKENPRTRQTTQRGRKRFFNAAIHALRRRVERTLAWEDKFKRLLLRFERIQQRHYGMNLMAYTLSNLRAFCGA